MAMIAWNVSAGDDAGVGLSISGAVAAEALLSGSGEVAAGASKTLALQIGDVSRIVLLVVSCTRYDGSVSIKGAGASDVAIALNGPIMIFGAAAARLAQSLESVTIAALAAPPEPATVSFLIGTSLS